MSNYREMSAAMTDLKISTDLKTFTLFPQLPPELRLSVWSLALPGPRVIILRAVEYRTSKNSSRPRTYQVRGCHIKLQAPAIAMLSVCYESRELVLKTHKPCFGPAKAVLEHPIYFNAELDTLVFGGAISLNTFKVVISREDRRHCRFIALYPSTRPFDGREVDPEWYEQDLSQYQSNRAKSIIQLGSVEEFALIVQKSGFSYQWLDEFKRKLEQQHHLLLNQQFEQSKIGEDILKVPVFSVLNHKASPKGLKKIKMLLLKLASARTKKS
jgi:hypothetical protein